MKIVWKVLTWFFVACGLIGWALGWYSLMQGTTLWIPTEFWFYDATVAGIFAIFFSVWGKINEKS